MEYIIVILLLFIIVGLANIDSRLKKKLEHDERLLQRLDLYIEEMKKTKSSED